MADVGLGRQHEGGGVPNEEQKRDIPEPFTTQSGKKFVHINLEGQGVYNDGANDIGGHISYVDHMKDLGAYYTGRNFPSQQTIYSRNSFAVGDPVMKKFGVQIGQDGVAEFIPQPNLSNMEHLFEQRANQPAERDKILGVNALIPEEMKKEFYSPSHFYEGVPRDPALRLMHIQFHRQRQERFYSFV